MSGHWTMDVPSMVPVRVSTDTAPVLLDLFCGAGGAAHGYQKAGFRVVGVDLAPQPHYCGDEFVQADALEYLMEYGHLYDGIHASPPCQAYSVMRNLPWLKGREYPALILPVKEMLDGLGKPYVIENVMGARKGAKGLTKRGLEAHGLEAAWLCGFMFGRPFYRHRLFASNWLWLAPPHRKHLFREQAPKPPKGEGRLGGRVRGAPPRRLAAGGDAGRQPHRSLAHARPADPSRDAQQEANARGPSGAG